MRITKDNTIAISPHRHPTRATAGTGRSCCGRRCLLITSSLVSSLLACSGPPYSDDVTHERLPGGGERTVWHRIPSVTLTLDTLAVWHLWQHGKGHVFGNVQSAASAPGGFYLLDATSHQVVQVDRLGTPQRVFGGQGAGPGEFQAPIRLFASDDELWVADLGLGRYAVFGVDGEFRHTVSWPGPGRLNPDGFAIAPDGTELFSTWSGSSGHWVLRRVSLDGSMTDTLAQMDALPRAPAVVDLPGMGPTTMYDPPACSPGLRWTSDGVDRVYTVTSADYRVEERDLGGQVRRELVGPTPDLTVTKADRQAFVTQFARLYAVDEQVLRDRNPGMEDRYPFAERRAAIESIRVDPTGRLWVLANTVGSAHTRLDLFDRDFSILGSLRDFPLPEAFTDDGDALLRIAGGDDGLDLFIVIRVADR